MKRVMGTLLKAPESGWPVARVAEALGVPLSKEGEAALLAWLDLLATWNTGMDLTAARSADELVDLMVADALVLSIRIPEGASVIDVGTGAGAPGLALALARPDLRVTLAEPLAKRVSFLRIVLATLKREDVTLERVRGEEVARRGQRWNVAMARATLHPPEWLKLGARLGDRVWVLLAKEEAPARTGATIEEDASYTWPLTGATRRVVRYAIKR